MRDIGVVDEASAREVPFPADGRGTAVVYGGILSNDDFRNGVELFSEVLVDRKSDPDGNVLVSSDGLQISTDHIATCE